VKTALLPAIGTTGDAALEWIAPAPLPKPRYVRTERRRVLAAKREAIAERRWLSFDGLGEPSTD
jgi:hypothetical protein